MVLRRDLALVAENIMNFFDYLSLGMLIQRGMFKSIFIC